VLGEGEARLVQARRFSEGAADLGQLPTQLAIAWCLRNPHVSTVILGASRVAQLKDNPQGLPVVAALADAAWRCVGAPME
ncbi:aldo/keto reductase, partial [Xylella fastidiosa]|uniref:aldo/keto reductase n=1 Tax=Xylella fastidiosa TaxID=2371 RepID=UPI0013239B60